MRSRSADPRKKAIVTAKVTRGKNWLNPIQERLGRSNPDLTHEELDEFNELARPTMKFRHDSSVRAVGGRAGVFHLKHDPLAP